jgi:hypothetical protein
MTLCALAGVVGVGCEPPAKAFPHICTRAHAGPLTNVALAVKLCPELPSMVGRLVVMGGAHGPGNVSPHAVSRGEIGRGGDGALLSSFSRFLSFLSLLRPFFHGESD